MYKINLLVGFINCRTEYAVALRKTFLMAAKADVQPILNLFCIFWSLIGSDMISFAYAVAYCLCSCLCSCLCRGGKMCQIVEGHNILYPRKSGGARVALFTNFQKKWVGQGPPGPPSSATPEMYVSNSKLVIAIENCVTFKQSVYCHIPNRLMY